MCSPGRACPNVYCTLNTKYVVMNVGITQETKTLVHQVVCVDLLYRDDMRRHYFLSCLCVCSSRL